MDLIIAATDEDVALRAMEDWPEIAPKAAILARGSDGIISGENPWTLVSPTNSFEAYGVQCGNVLCIDVSDEESTESSYEIFGIDQADGNTVTLHRLGMDSGFGLPPNQGAAIKFSINSAIRMLESCSYEIQREYNINSLDDIQDMDDLRWPTVNRVLFNLYRDAARNTGQNADDYGTKMRTFSIQMREDEGKLESIYGMNRLGSRSKSSPMTRPKSSFSYDCGVRFEDRF